MSKKSLSGSNYLMSPMGKPDGMRTGRCEKNASFGEPES